MQLICTACHAPLSAMSIGSGTVKVECVKCSTELLELREVLNDLRKVMGKWPGKEE